MSNPLLNGYILHEYMVLFIASYELPLQEIRPSMKIFT